MLSDEILNESLALSNIGVSLHLSYVLFHKKVNFSSKMFAEWK